MRFLIYGSHGWIGKLVSDYCSANGHIVIPGTVRREDYHLLKDEVTSVAPDRVINCAGITGRPNVDWCEDHVGETLVVNICGVINLAEICSSLNIHMSNYASGCIYTGGYDCPYTEEDEPNFTGSTYSFTKALAEKALSKFNNICQLRLRMPITSELTERNFITKILNYPKVVNIPNSMSLLDELIPVSIDLAVRGKTGVYNLVNPGVISHNQILSMYKEYVDPSYTWTNFTLEEQTAILKAPRSNCHLSSAKLEKEYILTPIEDGIRTLLKNLPKYDCK